MPRYIDADALIPVFEEMIRSGDYCKDCIKDAIYEVEQAPTLSPDEVRGVGEWEEKEYFDLENTTIEQMQSARCSVCGKYHTTPFSYYFTEYNYCPSCGAKSRAGCCGISRR